MIIERSLSHATIAASPTRVRQTPRDGTARFGELLRAGGEVLAAGAQAALRTLPGGPVLCAALRGGVTAAATRRAEGPGLSGQSPAAPSGSGTEGGGDLWQLTQDSQAFNLMYLQLQEEMSRENRRYSALSNVLKTRHETARAIISNV